jgi:hypothetical protein
MTLAQALAKFDTDAGNEAEVADRLGKRYVDRIAEKIEATNLEALQRKDIRLTMAMVCEKRRLEDEKTRRAKESREIANQEAHKIYGVGGPLYYSWLPPF